MPRFDGVPSPKPQKKTNKGKARASAMERRLAQDFRDAGDHGARRVLASGAYKGIGQDGDVEAKEFLAEAKNYSPVPMRGSAYVTLNLNWLYGKEGIMELAKLSGRPGLVVFQPKGRNYKMVLLDYDQFLALYARWSQRDE